MIDTATTWRAIEWAMDGIERRTDAIADNIANAEVPGFTARRVDFEAELARALDGGGEPVFTERASTAPPGPLGNNVRLEDELVDMIRTGLARSAMVESFSYKAGLLRTAVRGVA